MSDDPERSLQRRDRLFDRFGVNTNTEQDQIRRWMNSPAGGLITLVLVAGVGLYIVISVIVWLAQTLGR